MILLSSAGCFNLRILVHNLASEYSSDTILGHYVDLFDEYMEERENESTFIAQNTVSDVMDKNKSSMLQTLTDVVDISDMFDVGGPSDVGVYTTGTGKTNLDKYFVFPHKR